MTTLHHLKMRSPLPEGNVTLGLNNDVAGLASGFWAHDPLNRPDPGSEWGLVVEGVHGQLSLLQLHRHSILAAHGEAAIGRGSLGAHATRRGGLDTLLLGKAAHQK